MGTPLETDATFWKLITERRQSDRPTISHEALEAELLKSSPTTSVKSLIRAVLTFLLIMGVLYGAVRVLLALR
jgi:hypothetical protein